jgi:hypothetical protein
MISVPVVQMTIMQIVDVTIM